MSEDLRDVPSRADQLVDRAEYRRLSWEGAKTRIANHVRDRNMADVLKRLEQYSRGYLYAVRLPVRDDIRAALEYFEDVPAFWELAARETDRLRQRVEELEQSESEYRRLTDAAHDDMRKENARLRAERAIIDRELRKSNLDATRWFIAEALSSEVKGCPPDHGTHCRCWEVK